MQLICSDHTQIPKNIFLNMQRAAELILINQNLSEFNGEISLTFVDEEEIRRLNKNFRNIDKATDVLSFPQFEDKKQIKDNPNLPLGDVVICLDVAVKQSEEYGHSFEREVIYLFVHSILHLLGFDHLEDDDRKQMRAVEKEIMQCLSI